MFSSVAHGTSVLSITQVGNHAPCSWDVLDCSESVSPRVQLNPSKLNVRQSCMIPASMTHAPMVGLFMVDSCRAGALIKPYAIIAHCALAMLLLTHVEEHMIVLLAMHTRKAFRIFGQARLCWLRIVMGRALTCPDEPWSLLTIAIVHRKGTCLHAMFAPLLVQAHGYDVPPLGLFRVQHGRGMFVKSSLSSKCGRTSHVMNLNCSTGSKMINFHSSSFSSEKSRPEMHS